MSPGVLVIRADAAHAMGHGHVMRCLALAQAWQDRGGDCIFATAEPLPVLESRLRSEHIPVAVIDARPGSIEGAGQFAELARKNNARWIVVDGYQFGVEYQRVLKNAGHRVLAVDDYACIGTHVADIVLDQNAGASEKLYTNAAPGSKLLLGSRYAILRREFKAWRNWKREIPQTAKKILVTMGGSDPQNLTLSVVQALNSIHAEGIEAIVVVGSNNPHVQELNELARNTQHRIRIEIDPLNMAELMAWADVAIIAGGGTLWELLYMHCPVVSYARNAQQEAIISYLASSGCVQFAGTINVGASTLASTISDLASSVARRQAMSRSGRQTIDGLGAERICELITHDEDCSGSRYEAGVCVAVRS